MLVAAVLRPEQREDRELEVVRLAPEQLDDARELAVREAERCGEAAVRRPSSGGQCSRGLRRPPPGRNTPARRVVGKTREPAAPDHAARARGDLGLGVHVHRDRAPRPRAVDADPAPDRLRRARARRLRRGSRAAASRRSAPYVWPLALLGLLNTALAVLPDRLGPAVHRLRASPRSSTPPRRSSPRSSRSRSTRAQRVDGLRLVGRRRRLRRRRRCSSASSRAAASARRGRARRRRRRGAATRSARSTRAAASPGCLAARRVRRARLGDALRAAARRRPGDVARLGDALVRALPRRRRHRRRVPPLLRPDRRRRRLAGDPRHVPRARRSRSSTAPSSSTRR